MEKDKKTSIIISLICFLLLVFGSVGLYLKQTRAAFGNITGQLTATRTMTYYSNYPDTLELPEDKIALEVTGQMYAIEENKFELECYEFIGWNSLADGTGESYSVGTSVFLNKNRDFYAQWNKVVSTIKYGDIDLNGEINEQDYVILEQLIDNGSQLDADVRTNADVNGDGEIDLIDVDIVKQVCLGTAGYVGYLPDKIISVYEIYIDENNGMNDSDDEQGDSNDNQEEDNDSSNHGSNNNITSGEPNNLTSNNGSNSDSSNNDKNNNVLENNNSSNDDNNVNDKIENDDLEESDKDTFIDEEDNKKNTWYVIIVGFLIIILLGRFVLYAISKLKWK